MSYRTWIRASAALGILLMTNQAWPHHNMTALFDLNDRVTFKGTFTKVDWRNPHIQLRARPPASSAPGTSAGRTLKAR